MRRLVTTVLRNPTTPVTGDASWAVGATGSTGATAAVANMLETAVASSVFAAGAEVVKWVTVADGCVASTEVSDIDEAVLTDGVAVLTVVECLEFASVLAGVDVGSGADVVGGVLG